MFSNKYKSRLGFCIDTAHIFSAGYKIHQPGIFEKYMEKFNKLIGIDYIQLIHVNDSAAKLNSNIDRHTGIGKGYIYKNNTDIFSNMARFCFDHNIPMILETHDNYKKEIAFIKKIQTKMTRPTSDIKNKVINILTKLAESEKNQGRIYKHIAYLRAIKNLKLFTGNITKANLQKIEGIGKKISAKIKEILSTGKLKQFEIIKEDPILDAITRLNKIMGIGVKFANILVKNYKILNLMQLKKAYENNKIELNREQILGIKYYKHLQLKIKRDEVRLFESYIKKKLLEISKDFKLIVAGSYRRGKSEMGDIDIIIYNSKMQSVSKDLLKKIVDHLDKIIIANISLGTTKYSGLISLKTKTSKVRRLDIRIVPISSLPTTLFYFTGSKDFNTKIRLIAKKKGFLLNEYGLFKIKENKTKVKIPVKNEEDIFNKLDMKYVKPEDRK